MKTLLKLIISITAIIALSIALTGCGSGSGSYTGSRSTKAKTSVKTSGLVTSGFLAGALEIIISIPYGVTVELIPGTSNPSSNVVQLLGTSDPKMILNALDYVPATSTSKGSLKIIYLNAAGFTPSDSIFVQLDIATGFFPQAADFSLTKFEVTKMTTDGSTIYPSAPVSNPSFSVEII